MDFDLEAEKSLALTLALDVRAWDYAGDVVKPEMFGSEMARTVFEGVRSVVLASKPVTPVTVQAEIVKAGKSASVVPGWAKGRAASIEEIPALASRVRELWARRTLQAVAGEIAGLGTDQEAGKSAARLSEALAAVQAGGSGKALPMQHVVLNWLNELQDEANNPNASPVFYETGFAKVDKATGGLARGELSIFAARPGNGKSSWVMALAVNFAKRGIPVGMFWLEDDWRDAARRFLSRRVGCEAFKLRGAPGEALKHIVARNGFIEKSDLPIYVDDTHGLTIVDIAARMRRMHREQGVKVFILDHLGEVRIEKDERWGDRHDLALGRVVREYRDTAKSLGAVPILVSQMNRRIEQRGADTVPVMSDLDGSGQVEQAARLISFVQLHRNADGTTTGTGSLHIVKATGGNTGTIDLRWNGSQMTWEEA